MPQQTVFFDQRKGAKRVQVFKSYDANFARSCFDEMDESALAFLSRSLDLESNYEMNKAVDKLEWEDVEEEAREDGNMMSFFIVVEESEGRSRSLYVSPDWPSAEEFAKAILN